MLLLPKLDFLVVDISRTDRHQFCNFSSTETETASPTLPVLSCLLPSDAEDLAVKFKEHNAPCLQRTLTASRLGLSHLSSPSHTQSWRHNIWIQFITRNDPSQLNTKITFRCEGLLLQSYVQTHYYTLIKNMMFYFLLIPLSRYITKWEWSRTVGGERQET